MSRRRSASRLAAAALGLALRAAAAGGEAQTSNDEAQVKAAFVYNFLKFVEWPAGAFQGPVDALVVAVVGDGPSADATAQFLAGKQIGPRSVVVRRVESDAPIAGAHAVFVAEKDARRVRSILDAAAAAPILSIGEGAEFAADGGVIALVVEQRRVRFDINAGAAARTGLKISSKLLALTRVVYSTHRDGGGAK